MRPIKDDYNLDLIPEENRFGYKRKFDYHTGVDLFCDNNTPVYSMYNGHVTSIHEFTGFKESPWWNDTYAIMVYHPEIDKTFLYGELLPAVNINDTIHAGQLLGCVKQVLKKDKGRPMSMLHIECYAGLQNKSVWWRHGENMPENLEDITRFL
jgi:hypothetical protein